MEIIYNNNKKKYNKKLNKILNMELYMNLNGKYGE